MRRLFLYGNIADNFESNSSPFVQAAGGRLAKIALLLLGGPDREMDDLICLEIRDETRVKVRGRGRAYAARRSGPLKFEIQILEPGGEFEMQPAKTGRP